ncbi:hypothetical protein [Nocardioides aequoreus]|uniref:hypothetical protein n=1 Tax=Nocardioides aequoreus TaxID=397278 RepID=UPI0012F65C1F|nr:hypothetical protein [Nocardioides aequoreus]
MKFYAEQGPRRVWQMAADLAVVTWVWVVVEVGGRVDDSVDATARQVRRTEAAGGSLADNLAGAGEALGRTPLVGDDVRAPFDAAAGASRGLASSGAEAAQTIDTLGTWLGVMVVLVGVLLVLPRWLVWRTSFLLAASASRRLWRDGDLELLALRALTTESLGALSRRSPGAAGAWRRGDREVTAELARQQMTALGLRVPVGAESRRNLP